MRRALQLVLVVLVVLAAAAAPARAQDPEAELNTPQEVQEALSGLTPEQEQQLAEAITAIAQGFKDLDLPDIDLPSVAGALPDLSPPALDVRALKGLDLPRGSLPQAGAAPQLPTGVGDLLQDGVEGLQQLLDLLTFRWESDCAGKHKVVTGVLFLPTPLDVCGNLLPDVLATVTASGTSGGSVQITKLPLAPASMPLKIEAVLDLPDSTSAAAFGYDATATTAPGVFTAALGLSSGISLDLTTAGAGPSLAVIGELFKEGAGQTRTKSQRVRLGYAPVPATAGIRLQGGADAASVALTNSTPTTATLAFEDRSQADARRLLGARIERLPGTLSLALGQNRSLAYRASAAVGSVTAELNDFGANDALARQVVLQLATLPTQIDVAQPSATRTEITANGAIGSVFAGLASNRTVERLADPAYLYARSDGDGDTLAVRALGLRSAAFDSGAQLAVEAQLAPGPFRVLTLDGARRLEALVRDLPAELALRFDAASGRATYSGSAPIGELVASASDPAGLAGRATSLELLLRGIPTALALELAQSGDAFGVSSTAGELQLIEARLDDGAGTPPALPADRDGLVLRDTAADYGVFARLTRLRTVSVRQRPSIELLLDTAGGRVFAVDLAQSADGGDQTIVATVDALAPATAIRLVEDAGGRHVQYSAGAPVNAVTIAAGNLPLSGRARRADLQLLGLPQTVTLDLGREGTDRVALNAGVGGIASLAAQLTSGPNGTLAGSGLQLIDTDAQYTLQARVLALQSVAVQQRPSIDLDLHTGVAQAFTVSLRQAQAPQPDQTITAQVLNLPSAVRLQFFEDAAGRKLVYGASAPVGQITADADELPLSGRAKALLLDLRGLPAALTLNLGREGAGVDLNAGGAAIGSIDALLTSGPTGATVRVPSGFDGVRLTDVPATYAIAARISGLRRVSAQQSPLSLFLDSTARNPFQARLDQQPSATAKLTYTEATLRNLQPATTIALDDAGGRTQLSYSAAGAADRLDLATNAGDRVALTGSVVPLPAALSLCAISASNLCGNTSHPANKFSLRLTASAPATVNLFDCIAGSCAAPSEQMRVTNLTLQRLELNIHTEPICVPIFGCGLDGAQGQLWLDTDNFRLSGEAFIDNGGAIEITARFPPGFTANNRFVDYDGPFTDSSGSINCEGDPGGGDLDLDLELFDAITVDVAFILC